MQIIGLIIGLAIRLFMVTGLWTSFIMLFILGKIEEYDMNHSQIIYNLHNNPATQTPTEIVYLFLVLLPAIIITSNNIGRTISGNCEFSILKLRNKQKKVEKSMTNPSIPKGYESKEPIGVIFGKKGNSYAVKTEMTDGHILVVGGAGSGKSSCIAIPTLRAWQERVFAIDIKGELSEQTKEYRPNIKIFNPSDETCYGYNPFYILKESNNVMQDITQIANAIIPLTENIKEPFFINSARNYFAGTMLYYYEQGFSFIETMELIQTTPSMQMIEIISNSDSRLAKTMTNQFIGLDSKTLAGIFSEVSNKIILFVTDKEIRQALSKEEVIKPIDLEHGKDIYLVIEESKLDIWKNLLTLIVNQFLKHFEKRVDKESTPILFLLDEFARLGKIETIVNGLATLRSKEITICPIIQSLAQLDSIYGKDQRKVITDNCQFKAILGATDADTQEYFSKLVGTYDKEKKSRNSNFDSYTGIGKGKGTNLSTEEKRIIKPEQFGTLKDIVMLTPFGFFRVNKNPYYK